MGARVIIANGDGNIEARMRGSFEGEVKESEATRASLEAMAEIKEKRSMDKE